MSNTAAFESREAKLNKDIEDQIEKLGAASPLELPAADAEVSKLYVKKFEGLYNVERAKKDTDNAIDLLYIAYNTTPQAEGEIRVAISDIMNRLIKAQEQSELAMRRAMIVAANVLGSLCNTFPDWLDVRDCKGPEDIKGVAAIKDFVKNDVFKLAKKIKETALGVKNELDGIATTDSAAAVSKSETTLASRLKELAGQLKDKATIEKEIDKMNALREPLEELGNEIIQEIAFFFKSFADFMDRVSQEAGVDIALFDGLVGKDNVNAFRNLVLGADKFFLRQNAEWNAINFVSDQSCKRFADGRSKLNKLRGKYITGSELEAYLKEASVKLEEIVAEREEASK
jgi:hypothetical protein